jgi:hypothetical protein
MVVRPICRLLRGSYDSGGDVIPLESVAATSAPLQCLGHSPLLPQCYLPTSLPRTSMLKNPLGRDIFIVRLWDIDLA